MAARVTQAFVEALVANGSPARVTQALVEAAGVGSPVARATQVFLEPAAQAVLPVRVTQALVEVGGVGSPKARVSQVFTEVLVGPVDDPLRRRTHRQAANHATDVRLWYWRDNTWSLCPAQPVLDERDGVVIERTYRQPATADFTLPDNGGLLTPKNRNSAYNYRTDGTTYDPLIDEARKIRLECRLWCFANLVLGMAPTASLAPTAGRLRDLADLAFGTISSGSGYVAFVPPTTDDFTIVWDLGSVQKVRHAACRFGTRAGACTLPASVTFGVSSDNANWTEWPRKPVGGVDGDWDEDPGNQPTTVEMYRADMDTYARYVRLRITPQTAGQTIWVDEAAWYGSDAGEYVARNRFTGYLGDGIDIQPNGLIHCTATDVLKRLQDNNEVRLTPQYGGPSGAVELADILYTLLTAASCWRGAAGDYDAPWTNDEIGWTYGGRSTGFLLPAWQGQNNNLLGYCLELTNMIGWELYADPDGVLQLREPPYRQVLPDRVFVAAPDGNGELRNNVRRRTGKDMRNVVEVATGQSQSGGAAAVRISPNSIRLYGHRRVVITDPLLTTVDLREKACDYILRDYAWRLESLANDITGDFEVDISTILGFRAVQRPYLYPTAKNAGGDVHDQELWRVTHVREVITAGQWRMECDHIPYVSGGPRAPLYVKATPRVGNNTIIDVEWAPPADWNYADATERGAAAGFQQSDVGAIAYQLDTHAFYQITAVALDGTPTWGLITDATAIFNHLGISGYYVYVSSVSDVSGYPLSSSYWTGVGLYPDGMRCAVTGLTPGEPYWFYVTTVGPGPAFSEGNPSTVVKAVAGGGAGDESYWTVTDLSASFVEGNQGTDGLWHYHVDLLWTSPGDGVLPDDGQYGFKHAFFYFAVGTLPAPPGTDWQYEDEWHGDRIPPGMYWDRATPGLLTWPLRFAYPSQLSPGTTIYCRMQTWATTNGFGGPGHWSNVASCAVP